MAYFPWTCFLWEHGSVQKGIFNWTFCRVSWLFQNMNDCEGMECCRTRPNYKLSWAIISFLNSHLLPASVPDPTALWVLEKSLRLYRQNPSFQPTKKAGRYGLRLQHVSVFTWIHWLDASVDVFVKCIYLWLSLLCHNKTPSNWHSTGTLTLKQLCVPRPWSCTRLRLISSL